MEHKQPLHTQWELYTFCRLVLHPLRPTTACSSMVPSSMGTTTRGTKNAATNQRPSPTYYAPSNHTPEHDSSNTTPSRTTWNHIHQVHHPKLQEPAAHGRSHGQQGELVIVMVTIPFEGLLPILIKAHKWKQIKYKPLADTLM